MDLCTVKRDFGHLVEKVEPWILSHFVMWLDIKVAEYKINGLMLLDNTPNDTPKWLRRTLRGFKHVEDAEKYHNDKQEVSGSVTEESNRGKRFKAVNQKIILEAQESKKCTEIQKSRPETGNRFTKVKKEQISERHLTDSLSNMCSDIQHKQYSQTNSPVTISPHVKPICHGTEQGHIKLNFNSPFQLRGQTLGNLSAMSEKGPVRQSVSNVCNFTALENSLSLQEPESSNICQQETVRNKFSHSPQDNEVFRSKVKIEISSDDEGNSSTIADPSEVQLYSDDLESGRSNNQEREWQNMGKDVQHSVKLFPVSKFENDFVSKHTDVTNFPPGTEGQSGDENSAHNPELITSLHNNSPILHSRKIQRVIPFPERFPIESIMFGPKAQEMILTGEITRAAKMQFLEAIFNELVKYTGLYPTPTQKMSVAKAIVESFPALAGTCRDSNESPADSWYVTLNDKFRNERRGLVHGEVTRKGKLAKRLHASAAYNRVFQSQRLSSPGNTDVKMKFQRLSDSDINTAEYIGMDNIGKVDQAVCFDDRIDMDFNPDNKFTWTLEENKIIKDFEMMTGQHHILSTFQNKWSSFCESIISAAEQTEGPSVQRILQQFQSQTTLTRDEMSALCLHLLCQLLLSADTDSLQSNTCQYLIDYDQGPLSSEGLLADRTNAYIQVYGPLKQISKISIQKENHEIVSLSSGIDHSILILIAVYHNLALPMPDILKIPLTFLTQFVLGFCDKSDLPFPVYQLAERFNLL